MADEPFGIVLGGMIEDVRRAYDRFLRQPVDWDRSGEPSDPPDLFQNTIREPVSVTGPGTFFGRAQRTLWFEPTENQGWWFNRSDLAETLPIRVSVRNVWNTTRNIVLRSGSPHNYMRMVEHIIALRLGMGIDNLVVRVDSGDPPLFERGSMDLVEALERAGPRAQPFPVNYVTVTQPVTVGGPRGSFLTFLPCEPGVPALRIDCAIDFPNAIGRQRVKFTLNRRLFRDGAVARTNTTAGMVLYCHTVGKLFADIRNLGYTNRNILIAGRRRYSNRPGMIHDGKSLEAVWHRALLDLLAAVALIDQGRFVGTILSYKAGHALDVAMIGVLYKYGLLKLLDIRRPNVVR